jgi:NDP-sugar pyrophosphorylase family protein
MLLQLKKMKTEINIGNCKAMIFAAGLGTRLKPFTNSHPKALAVVNGKTLLQRNLEYLQGFGIQHIVINTHHFADQINDFILNYKASDIKIAISHELDGPYETGGGLAFAASQLTQSENPFIVMNVDMLTDLDLKGMFEFHQKIQPLATLAVTKRKSSRQLLFNDEMSLVGWKNNSTQEFRWVNGEVEHASAYSFSGIHIIQPAIFNMMPSSGVFSIIDIYLKSAASNLIVGYDHSGDKIIDVGKPESISEAEELFRV